MATGRVEIRCNLAQEERNLLHQLLRGPFPIPILLPPPFKDLAATEGQVYKCGPMGGQGSYIDDEARTERCDPDSRRFFDLVVEC